MVQTGRPGGSSAGADGRGLSGFFSSRWAGAVPLARVFWGDMLVNGTTINLLSALAGLALFAAETPTAVAATVYLAPVPYNVFLLLAVWRAAGRGDARHAMPARVAALLWFVVVLAV